MPPKGSTRKKAPNDPSAAQTPTLAEQLSFLHSPRPFKSLVYTKNANRRTKNLKTVLTQERERERAEREQRRQDREVLARAADDAMDVDTSNNTDKNSSVRVGSLSSKELHVAAEEDMPTYTSIEAPPSLLPPRHYCDITGLEAPYTDPKTGLRYHDKSVYELIKGLSPSMAKDYLAARGVNPIVK